MYMHEVLISKSVEMGVKGIEMSQKRLPSPYVLRTMLEFFSWRSRPIRSTENYFA